VEHSFLFIRTKQGKDFVLELSGQQFGIPDTFYKWEDYERLLYDTLDELKDVTLDGFRREWDEWASKNPGVAAASPMPKAMALRDELTAL
jgi:hypothetical protein